MTVSFDRICVEKAVAGDRAALDRLLLDSYPPLFEYITARLPAELRPVTGVDDIIQLVYSQVFGGIDEFTMQGAGAWLAWLRAIADNRIRDALRAEQAKKRGGEFRRVSAVSGCGDSHLVDELVGVYATTTQTPSREVARTEAIMAIQIAIAGLSEEYQQVIRLRYFEGCAVDEIAARLNKTPGAVRGLLDRARKKIREVLESASRYLSSK